MPSFDQGFEREILAHAAWDPKYRRQSLRVLQDHRFADERYTWLWRKIRDLPSSDRFTPKLGTAYAAQEFPDEKKRVKYLEAIKDVVLDCEPQSPAASLEQLDKFIRYHRVIAAINNAAETLRQNTDIQSAEDILNQALKGRSVVDYDYGDYIEGFEDRQAHRRALAENPSLGINVPCTFSPTLDRVLEGGIEPGEVGIILGTTGRGKSTVAVNLAFNGAAAGYETIFIVTEMNRQQVETRLDARMLHEEFAAIKYHRYNEAGAERIKAKAAKFREQLAKKLRVVHIPVGKCTAHAVRQAIEDMTEDGMKPKLFVFDSCDHMEPSVRFQTRRDRETASYWELKSIADEYGLATWTTTHAPRDVVNKVAGSENVGESYDKARICDILISINQTKAQKEESRARFFLGKYRSGKDGVMIEVEVDSATMHIREVEPDEDDDY